MLRLLQRSVLSRSFYSTQSHPEKPLPSLVSSITPELRQEITGDSSHRKFRLESLKGHLSSLHEYELPLPESLSVQEWGSLLDLKTFIARAEFFIGLRSGEKEYKMEELQELDELWDNRTLTYDPKDVQDLSPEDDKKFRLLLLYRDSLLEDGERVPSHMKKSHIESALKKPSGSRSLKTYFDFLASNEHSDNNRLIKRKIRRFLHPEYIAKRKDEIREGLEEGRIIYGLGQNSLFIRFANKIMDQNLNWRVLPEFDPVNGSPLVIDLSFLKTMNEKHARSFIHNELFYGLNWNRNARMPYALYLTEFDPLCEHCQYLSKTYPHLFESTSPIVITEKSYLDLFPSENLLYLSPDSKQDLNFFRGSDIPIIGAIVDPAGNQPLTLGKAKKQGIRHARLPMKKIIGINAQLNIDHMVAIMCEWRYSRDWLSALRFVPSRFFSNRQKSISVLRKSRTEEQMNAITRVFKTLSPKGHDSPLIPAGEYRAKMNELLRSEGLSSEDLTPWKTLFSPKKDTKIYNYMDYVQSRNYKRNNLVHRNKKLRIKDYVE
eukprot:TRINITY_DN25088_c0_g1_i1.p1 TRINITY_DN25088_c0_g1~~TRINITY_DN25088_c0_g1_i1.p1  ORF type:complete len:547 (-),score=152.32 TRINITY_DN25088_c0_g1_i1:451-2091(-)